MNKLILRDGSEITIHEGMALPEIVVDVSDYAELEELSGKLTPENLRVVKFSDGGSILSTHTGMTMLSPRFRVDNADDGSLAVMFGIRALTEEELQLDALERKQNDIATAIAYLSDEQAATVKELYPVWKDNSTYKTGDRVQYEDKLYKCLSEHAAQPSWNPADAPSLWTEILTRPGEILPWKQPDSTNGYHKGDKVTHKGQTWESDIDNNVWEPGAVGTEALWHVVV